MESQESFPSTGTLKGIWIAMNTKRYFHLSSYLREKYGTRIHKITVDAGFTCPNRDGTLGWGGCIYCNNSGFSANSRPERSGEDLDRQIRNGIEWAKRRYRAEKFIVYFQAYSNTYASVEELESLYSRAISHPGVIGLDIGTRPDCVDPAKIDLIARFAELVPEVWLEYGLQSSHDRTLALINRCDTYAHFTEAVHLAEGKGINLCAHVILGLPGETREDMLVTAERLAGLPINGIKIHLLHVLRGTPLEEWYRRGDLRMLERNEYVNLVCDFLEKLPPGVVCHRLTGEAPPDLLIAPEWCKDKGGVLADITREFERRDTRQGVRWKTPVSIMNE